jgi:endonuclease/exonuclease/phosphatase family metal-dependent hydrolase
MRVLSYNLEKFKATDELAALAARFDLDVMCLQECDSATLPSELGGMHLADSTKGNRLGLAIYYRRTRYDAIATQAFALKKSLHDMIASPAHERLLASLLRDRETGTQFTVSSFHASPLTALNSLRRAQIALAHEQLAVFGGGSPELMVGDYNYPLFKNRLTARVGKTGHELTLSDGRTYTRYRFVRGHFDFATSVGMKIHSVETLPQGKSDHLPILVTATVNAPASS